MTAPRITLDLCDLGFSHAKPDLRLIRLLQQRFRVELSDQPQFLIYSHAGDHHRLFSGVRIFFTTEADYPLDWSVCDYAMTTHYSEDPRHLRFPPYTMLVESAALMQLPGEVDRLMPQKTKFAGFLSAYRNEKTRVRWDFFEKLSQYKKVDSAGRAGNNVGFEVPRGPENTINFLRPYKFHLAFENKVVPGYVSEKLLFGLAARCIPIYYGCPRVAEEFNPKRFLNYHDFPSEEALIARIQEIDANDNLFRQYLAEPIFNDNRPNPIFDPEYFCRFFEKVFTTPIVPAAVRNQQGWRKMLGRWTLARADKPTRLPWNV